MLTPLARYSNSFGPFRCTQSQIYQSQLSFVRGIARRFCGSVSKRSLIWRAPQMKYSWSITLQEIKRQRRSRGNSQRATRLSQFAGLSRARNRGLSESKSEIVAYLDDDALPDERWLDFLLEPFADPRVGAVTGRTILPEAQAGEIDQEPARFLKQRTPSMV